ncbi:MAG TPA: hypothetical protein VI072_35350 [Polyangiaceae bacterium]
MKKSKRASTRAGAEAPKRSRRARASSVRAWIAVVPLLASAAITGCPGALDNPERFLDGSAGGSDNCGSIPQLLQQTCSGSACHSSADSGTGLDLVSTAVAERLVGVPGSAACGDRLLIDPNDPANSLLLLKLDEPPPCGSRMPLGSELTAEQKACVRTWIDQVIGAVGTGGAGGRDGGAGMSGAGGTAGSSGMGGSAGRAGSGGTSGMGGSAGRAGTGGTSGMGGSAGRAGTGGTAGMGGAGMAGMSGMGGSAGMAGMSGMGGSAGMAGMSGDGGGGGDGGTGGVADSGTD